MNKISVDSATQLNRILSFLPEDRKQKIPPNIWKEINQKTDDSLNTKINEITDIKEENMLQETRKYLSFIFLNYLATKEEKEEYVKIIKNNETQYQKFLSKKYNVDNIFKERKTSSNIETEVIEEKRNNLPIEYKEGFFKCILNKIKSLIKHN